MNAAFLKLFADIPVKEIAPGYHSKLIHTDTNTLNFLDVEQGAAVALHQHMHEQLSFVLEGSFEMTVDGEVQILDPGMFVTIPGNIIHGGKALTACKLLDVFSPVRQDYKDL